VLPPYGRIIWPTTPTASPVSNPKLRSIAALNHPNIVALFSVELSHGTHFLTVELVEGQSLNQFVGY